MVDFVNVFLTSTVCTCICTCVCLNKVKYMLQVKIVDDMQPTGGNLPYMKAEDAQYFQKLLV